MKTAIRQCTAILLLLCTLLAAVSCTQVEKSGAWESATHLSDKTFGNGAKTVTVEVVAEEQTVTFTIKTDKEFLGDALAEHELITGEEGQYGLYITSVNGMAIAEGEQAYWALYKDGAYSMTGVDLTPIANGECYELVKESY